MPHNRDCNTRHVLHMANAEEVGHASYDVTFCCSSSPISFENVWNFCKSPCIHAKRGLTKVSGLKKRTKIDAKVRIL